MQILKRADSSWLKIILAALGIIYIAHAIYYPSSYEGADGLRHYLVSRYSWKHPYLFLYLWGKPFFTLISSPFSQFGLIGLKLFNILCALLSCLVVYRMATVNGIRNQALAVFLMGFTPIYFFCTNSGYTELLFGFMLSWAAWRYMVRDYFWPTIVISFLPFVRSEGYILLGLFFLVLVIRKQWKLIPLLATGNILYTVIGYFHYHSWTWLASENPYDGRQAAIYGHGPWYHFIKAYWVIFGLPLTILLVAGLIYPIARYFYPGKNKSASISKEEGILVYGSFILYFTAHTIFWWKGLFNSLGLERVMAAVIPVAGIIYLRGWNWFASFIPSYHKIRNWLLGILLLGVIICPFHYKYFPLRLDQEELLIREATTWYKQSEYAGQEHVIYYLHPYFLHALNQDAFDPGKVQELWGLYPSIKSYGYSAIPEGAMVFWDAHFGPNEGLAPLDTLLHDPHFNLVKYFSSGKAKIVLGGRPFEIYVFQKTEHVSVSRNLDKFLFTLDDDRVMENPSALTTEKAFSGSRSTKLSSKEEYSVGIVQPAEELNSKGLISRIHFRWMLYAEQPVNALAVISTHANGVQTSWNSFPIEVRKEDVNKWTVAEGDWMMNPALVKNAHQVKLYIWNKNKQEFFADDFEFSLYDK